MILWSFIQVPLTRRFQWTKVAFELHSFWSFSVLLQLAMCMFVCEWPYELLHTHLHEYVIKLCKSKQRKRFITLTDNFTNSIAIKYFFFIFEHKIRRAEIYKTVFGLILITYFQPLSVTSNLEIILFIFYY